MANEMMTQGKTPIEHLTLIQDHDEGGTRAPDVELFVRSQYIRKARQLLEPHPGLHTNFARYWINTAYGHLRQGTRLLMSTCPFDELRGTHTGVPYRWRLFFQTLGTMRGLTPAVSQKGMKPHTRYNALSTTGGIGGGERTVRIKAVWSVGEVLMEPLHYNPCMGTWWGATWIDAGEWECHQRKRNGKVCLIRRSDERRRLAKEMHALTLVMADMGLTHVVDITRDWNLRGGGRLATYDELWEGMNRQSRMQRQSTFTRAIYTSLTNALPQVWKDTIHNVAIHNEGSHQQEPLREAIRRVAQHTPLPADTWVQRTHESNQQLIGKLEDKGPWVLHLFAGKAGRTDGLAASLTAENIRCLEIDILNDATGQDILNEKVFNTILAMAEKGEFIGGVFGIPCSTCSIVRFLAGGPRPVRNRRSDHLHGRPDLTPQERREVQLANEMVRRSILLAKAIARTGGEVLFENPSDRGGVNDADPKVRDIYQQEWANHVPLWTLPEMQRLAMDLGLRKVTFPQCGLGSKFEKMTTLWYTAGLANELEDLHICICLHRSHKEVARGKRTATKWKSAEAAAYPARMNALIARTFGRAVQSMRQHGRIFKTAVDEWWTTTPQGRMIRTKDMGGEQPIWRGHAQVHVWQHTHLAHCEVEEDWLRRHDESRQPPTRWYGGCILESGVLWDKEGEVYGRTNLGDWAWHYGETDRCRAPVNCASADTHHIYAIQLSNLFHPLRTFDILRRYGSSTTWVDLLPGVLPSNPGEGELVSRTHSR